MLPSAGYDRLHRAEIDRPVVEAEQERLLHHCPLGSPGNRSPTEEAHLGTFLHT